MSVEHIQYLEVLFFFFCSHIMFQDTVHSKNFQNGQKIFEDKLA